MPARRRGDRRAGGCASPPLRLQPSFPAGWCCRLSSAERGLREATTLVPASPVPVAELPDILLASNQVVNEGEVTTTPLESFDSSHHK